LSERDPRAEAEVLVRKAKDDANAMGLLVSNAEISDEIIGFHAQQAVEKWLKAVLWSRGIEFEYTHDLRRLIAEVTAAVGEFPSTTARWSR
jgi:HEPN domain-containing protein